MSRLILIQEDDFERQYRESMSYLDSKYHDQPTRLKPIPLTDDQLSAIYGGVGLHNQQPARRATPIGKLVI